MHSVEDAAARCLHVMSEVRCELAAGHRSAHAARHGEMMLHWKNELAPADKSTAVALDWAQNGDTAR